MNSCLSSSCPPHPVPPHSYTSTEISPDLGYGRWLRPQLDVSCSSGFFLCSFVLFEVLLATWCFPALWVCYPYAYFFTYAAWLLPVTFRGLLCLTLAACYCYGWYLSACMPSLLFPGHFDVTFAPELFTIPRVSGLGNTVILRIFLWLSNKSICWGYKPSSWSRKAVTQDMNFCLKIVEIYFKTQNDVQPRLKNKTFINGMVTSSTYLNWE